MTKVSIRGRHEGQAHFLRLSDLRAIDRLTSGPMRVSLAAGEDEIRRALDRLFTGF
jgi:hypothetical protein